MYLDKLNRSISKYLPKESSVFWYWQGRVALYAILKAIGIKPGDEVIIPAYTCVVVPNAIIYMGANPVYVDIDPKTYNMDISKLENAITKKTKVIICQNTYGLSSNVEFLIDIAKKYSLYTIEDCTHGFGGYYAGKPNGSYCDAAFYSTQWNKPFSTGIGGFAVTQNNFIKTELQKQENQKIEPTFKDKFMLKVLYFIRNKIINDFTYWNMVKAYRWLSKHNIVLGSSKGEEINSTNMPEKYFKNFTEVQAKEGLKNIKKLDYLLELRKKNAQNYTDFLSAHGKNHVPLDLFKNHSFLKYPLLVKNRDFFMQLAEEQRVSLGDWFLSPLHPANRSCLSKWSFLLSEYENAADLSFKVVNLPTDIVCSSKVIAFLDKNLSEII